MTDGNKAQGATIPRAAVAQVRGALAHLYDPAYLQTHPLAAALPDQQGQDRVTRAQALRRLLLEGLDRLKPGTEGADAAEAVRAYAILTYRYIDGLTMEEIAAKLALSRRQAYREHKRGMQAVASVLHDLGLFTKPAAAEVAPDHLEAARAEVAHLRRSAHPEPVALADVLDGVINTVAPAIRQGAIDLVVAGADVAPRVVADRGMLRQALLNLVGQAVEAGAVGTLAICVTRSNGGVLVAIQGQMPPATAPLSMPPPIEVNLAVTRALVEAQGGSLEMAVAQGQWQAHLTLPLAEKTTLLVIDDNADLIRLVQRYLTGYELAVVGATDGECTVSLALDLGPSLILLDIMMPNLDGWEILRRLRERPELADTPIVICSVLQQAQMALALGANAYLPKPLSQPDLLRVLRQYLGGLWPLAR